MAKKPSGLGRGLGDLLEDNAPQIRGGSSVVKKNDGVAIHITPPPSPTPAAKPKGLYDDLPKNRSIKANFKNFNR